MYSPHDAECKLLGHLSLLRIAQVRLNCLAQRSDQLARKILVPCAGSHLPSWATVAARWVMPPGQQACLSGAACWELQPQLWSKAAVGVCLLSARWGWPGSPEACFSGPHRCLLFPCFAACSGMVLVWGGRLVLVPVLVFQWNGVMKQQPPPYQHASARLE